MSETDLTLFQNNPYPMWVYEVATRRFLVVNAAAVRQYGYSREEFARMTLEDIRPESELPRLAAFLAQGLSGVAEPTLWLHRKKSGELMDMEIASHDFTFEGKPARMVVAIDVTRRTRAEAALRASEERYRKIVDLSPDAITIHEEGRFVFANAATARLLGVADPAQLIGRSLLDFMHPDIHEQVQARWKRLYEDREVVEPTDLKMTRPDGSVIYLETRAAPLYWEGRPAAQVVARDTTERRQHEQKIARLSRIHAVLSGINSAIVHIRERQSLFEEACRIAVEHGGFSSAWAALLDTANDRLISRANAGLPLQSGTAGGPGPPLTYTPAGTAATALRTHAAAFDNDIESSPEVSFVRQTAIGVGAKSVIALPLMVGGEAVGVLVLYAPDRGFFDDDELRLLNELAADISFSLEFIATSEKVDYLAYYDPLTGLPNRNLFFDRMAYLLGAAGREATGVALVLIDLDRFRQVNDTLGRNAGDALLNAVAQRLRQSIRDQDTVARVGSNRFALAVAGVADAADAAHFVESRVRACFDRSFTLNGEEVRIAATAGIALYPADADGAESVFANAEAALRRAKLQSAPFLFYGPEMNARVSESLRLETKLRRAIENDELVLWYQPKIDLATRRMTGFEALMRWQDPESGMVPPAVFIPVMEQTGLILDAGAWALSQVARDCRLCGARGLAPMRIAVNVSPIQLRQRDFVAGVLAAAAEMTRAGGRLDLEITESMVMEDINATVSMLRELGENGVRVAVDDFGTGYSSLAYIARLPVHALKIDRSFVVGMTQNEHSLAIVRAIISLARSLGLKVIAEGVETEGQAGLLQRLECDEMQGYLVSRPVPPEEVIEFLAHWAEGGPAR